MKERVLILDNDRDFVGPLADRLSDLGLDVEVVTQGQAGLELAVQWMPNVVVVSVVLPDMSGFLVCKKLKKDAQLKTVPVVIVSDDGNADDIFAQHRKLRTRAEDYVRKPIDVVSMVDTLGKWVTLGPEATQVEQISAPPAGTNSSKVDMEIESFAEDAFDSLISDDSSEDMTRVASALVESEPVRQGSRASAAPQELDADDLDVEMLEDDDSDLELEPVDSSDLHPSAAAQEITEEPGPVAMETAKNSVAPDAAPTAHSPVPGPAGDDAVFDAEKLLKEMRHREADYNKLLREVEQLRARASRAPSITSHDYLDLRESLNEKDRELLRLKDELASRDKEILKLRDASLGVERSRADLQVELGEATDKLEELHAEVRSLKADRESGQKREEDTKRRLERAEEKVRGLEQEMDAVAKAHREEVSTLKREGESRVAELQQGHEERSRADLEAFESKIAEQREQHETLVNALQQEKETEVSDLRRESESREAVLTAQHQEELKTTRDRLEKERALEVKALRDAHRAEVEAKVAHLKEQSDAALEEQRERLTEESRASLSEVEQQHEAALARLNQEHAVELEGQEHRLHANAEATMQQLKGQHQEELALLGRRLSESESSLAERESELEAARKDGEDKAKRILELNDEMEIRDRLLVQKSTELDKLQQEFDASRKSLESECDDMRGRLADMKKRREQDEELLSRARRALEIGMGLLDHQGEGDEV